MNRRRPRQAIPEFKQTPGVLFQPEAHLRMQKGINLIVEAVRPTLGPRPRNVAVEKIPRTKSPELLDNGGIIARRIIDLKDPDENMGAMFLRGALWRLYEKVGDGTATAAVIFQTVYNQGLKYIAAGGNAMLLRQHLEDGLKIIFNALDEMVTPVEGKEMLSRVAQSVCYDEELATILGDIFDLIGEYGILQIRGGRSRVIEKEYIEGSFWSGGLYSKDMIFDINKQRTQFINASILLSDLELDEPEQLVPVLEAVAEAQIPNLVIMANKVSDKVMGLLAVSQKQSQVQMVAVKVPGMRLDEQMMALEDLAILTGGATFIKAAGDTFKNVSAESFGQARKIWADMNYLGVSGGKGDPLQRRKQIEKLRRGYLLEEEADLRTKLPRADRSAVQRGGGAVDGRHGGDGNRDAQRARPAHLRYDARGDPKRDHHGRRGVPDRLPTCPTPEDGRQRRQRRSGGLPHPAEGARSAFPRHPRQCRVLQRRHAKPARASRAGLCLRRAKR